ncbi:GbpC/Spa domain-containing protein [Eupransor demetentiae]|uniref:Uncharacterized protein n=1 Tax=Eupransor demetentiae TaxID=3109584 RepID=A0ABM9N3Z4_9LACO|nr:hypothetical protein R54876_GBNLAHCA_00434 [Lactobacillaceae bacterium LMG 33000]
MNKEFNAKNLNNKLALGVFSIAGIAAGSALLNQNNASADDTTTSNQESQAQANQVSTEQQSVVLPSTTADKVTEGTSTLPSPALDQAVKDAQADGLKTQQTDGNHYTGTADQYDQFKQESDADYANQVSQIKKQIQKDKAYDNDLQYAKEQNAAVDNAAAKAQSQGVNVIKDADQDGLSFNQIEIDSAKQVNDLNAATSEQLKRASEHAQTDQKVKVDNQELTDKAKQAEDAGVTVKQAANQSSATYADELADKQKQLTDLNQAIADQSAAMTKYQAEVDQVKKDNAAKQADYEAAQSKYEAAKAKNQELRYQFDQEMSDYKKKLNALEKQAQESGYASQVVNQALKLDSEPNAKVALTASPDVQWYYQGKADSNGPTFDDTLHPNLKTADGQPTQWAQAHLNAGQSITAVYTNLNNSSYEGKPISKVVKTFTYEENKLGEAIEVDVPTDPTLDVWYNGLTEGGQHTRALTEVDKFYDADGKQITFGNDAVLTIGSLNNYYNGQSNSYIEKSKIDGATFIPVNNGTIKEHADGWAYADKDNTTFYDNWDNDNSLDFYIGSAIYRLQPGSNEVTIHLQTNSGPSDGNRWTWSQSSTSVPLTDIPAMPAEPKYEAEVQPVAPSLTPEPAKPTTNVAYHLYDNPADNQPVTIHYHNNIAPDNAACEVVHYHYNTVTIEDKTKPVNPQPNPVNPVNPGDKEPFPGSGPLPDPAPDVDPFPGYGPGYNNVPGATYPLPPVAPGDYSTDINDKADDQANTKADDHADDQANIATNDAYFGGISSGLSYLQEI